MDSPLEIKELPNTLLLNAGHKTPQEIVDEGLLTESTVRKSFVFSIVRNPWARFVSLFCGIGEDYRWTIDFNLWLKDVLSDKTRTASDEGTPLGRTQDEWVFLNGERVADAIPLERIDTEFFKLARRLGLEEKPLGVYNSHTHRPYTEFYNRHTIRLVEEASWWVIQEFDYKFGEDVKHNLEPFRKN